MSDPRTAGLDPAHILGVALQAVGNGHSRSGRVAVLTTSGQVRVCLPSRRASLGVAATLIRVGYQVTRVGGLSRPDVLVAGWSAAGLEARLAAMRNVLHELDARPLAAAATVIERVRHQPLGAPAVPDAEVLAGARTQLRTWVSARAGVHVPHNPAILPGNRANTLRLRTAWTLETAIDRLIERQVRAAENTLWLFRSMRRHVGADQAQQIVLRQPGPTVRPDTSGRDASLAQDSSELVRRTAPPMGPGPRFPGPHLSGGTGAGPVSQAASGFPHPVNRAIADGSIAAAWSAHPGGRHFPVGRPGLRR